MSGLCLCIGAGACGSSAEVTANAPTSARPTSAPLTSAVIVDSEFDDLADFEAATFAEPTTIDNEWFPLSPGAEFTYEGTTIEEGVAAPHRYILTVTDLTKEVLGVQTVVVWDQDFSHGVLVEAEIALFAQDDAGNVWHFGQYPEEYEEGQAVATPGWIAGFEGARPGITVKATPDLGGARYSQGWGPAVIWTDRARASAGTHQPCRAQCRCPSDRPNSCPRPGGQRLGEHSRCLRGDPPHELKGS